MQDDRTCEAQVNKTLLFGTSRSHVALGASSLSKLPCLPESQVSLDILCFISLDLAPLAGAGKDMDSCSAEEPACPPQQPSPGGQAPDRRHSGWLAIDTPRPESAQTLCLQAMPPPWNLLCRQKEPGDRVPSWTPKSRTFQPEKENKRPH